MTQKERGWDTIPLLPPPLPQGKYKCKDSLLNPLYEYYNRG